MNKADWQTAVAAGLISLSICRDGLRRVKSAFAQLMNQRPMNLEGNEPDTDMEKRIRKALAGFDWITDVELRLHEDGHLVSGIAFVHVADREITAEMIEKVRAYIADLHWRLYCIEVVPVSGAAR